MMNALFEIGIVSVLMHAFLYDWYFMFIYIVLIGGWFHMVNKTRNMKENPKRKTIMAATWCESNDATSFIIEDINCTKTVEWLKELNETSGLDIKIDIGHVTSHAVACGLYKMRRDVCRLTFGFMKHSKKIGTSIFVDYEGVFVPVTIWNGHELSLIEFAKKYEELAAIVKSGKCEAFNRATAYTNMIPTFLLQPMIWIISYVNINLGYEIPQLGLTEEFMGHYSINDLSKHGLTQTFTPFYPWMRSFGITTIGKIIRKPVVVDDEIKIQDMINLTQTGDHRFGDAAIWIPLHRILTGYLTDAKNFDITQYKETVHWSEKKSN